MVVDCSLMLELELKPIEYRLKLTKIARSNIAFSINEREEESVKHARVIEELTSDLTDAQAKLSTASDIVSSYVAFLVAVRGRCITHNPPTRWIGRWTCCGS